jgi:hypothetical protein
LVPLTYGLGTWRPRIIGNSKNVLIPGFTVVVLDDDCLVVLKKPDAHPAMLGVDQLGIVGKVTPCIFAQEGRCWRFVYENPSGQAGHCMAPVAWRALPVHRRMEVGLEL